MPYRKEDLEMNGNICLCCPKFIHQTQLAVLPIIRQCRQIQNPSIAQHDSRSPTHDHTMPTNHRMSIFSNHCQSKYYHLQNYPRHKKHVRQSPLLNNLAPPPVLHRVANLLVLRMVLGDSYFVRRSLPIHQGLCGFLGENYHVAACCGQSLFEWG